jgi:hypothetical protein
MRKIGILLMVVLVFGLALMAGRQARGSCNEWCDVPTGRIGVGGCVPCGFWFSYGTCNVPPAATYCLCTAVYYPWRCANNCACRGKWSVDGTTPCTCNPPYPGC